MRDTFGDDQRPVVRADAGYFAAELAHTAVGLGCDFAVAAKRNRAMWRAAAGIREQDWTPAIGMPGAQVAVSDYAPAGWPPHTYTLIRRVRVDAEKISTAPRSRRRRTIDRDQLALLLDGVADHGWDTSGSRANSRAPHRLMTRRDDGSSSYWRCRRTDSTPGRAEIRAS